MNPTRTPLLIGTVATLLAVATACSSHWSNSAESDVLAVEATDDAVARYHVGSVLEATDYEPLDCAQLGVDVTLAFTAASEGPFDYAVFVQDADEVLSEGSERIRGRDLVTVAWFAPFVQVSPDRCAADLILELSSPGALKGAFGIEALASDASSSPDDDPGETAFEVVLTPL